MKDYNAIYGEYVKKTIEVMKEAGLSDLLPDTLSFKLNPNLNYAVGQCVFKESGTEIQFGEKYFKAYVDNDMEHEIINTLVHETLHSLPDSHNHGKTWKKHAKTINDMFDLKIERLAPRDKVLDMLDEEEKFNMVKLVCIRCDKETYVKKSHKAVKNPDNFTCRCGGGIRVEK